MQDGIREGRAIELAASVPTSSLRVQILTPSIPGSVRPRQTYVGLTDLIIQKTKSTLHQFGE